MSKRSSFLFRALCWSEKGPNVKYQISNTQCEGWRPALAWGFGIALAHRLLLGLWMAIVWVHVSVNMLNYPMSYQPHGAAGLPVLQTPFAQLVLGLWRRWDAKFYLSLAHSGYSTDDPGATIFGVLTPLGIHLLDIVLPGPVDIAGLVFSVLAFGLALTLLHRICEVYYQDADLGRQSVILMALLPLSYFFSAPMSEAIYLAMVLAMVYMGMGKHWGLAALFGALATLARTQGVMMAVVGVALILEQQPVSMTLRQRSVDMLKKVWPLVLIPLSYVGFIAYRENLGLPSLNETYHNYSYTFFVNPVEGFFINIRWFFTHLSDSFLDANFLALLVTIPLLVLSICDKHHRRPLLVTYSIAFVCLFISKLSWWYGTREVIASINFGRYSLALFPLVVLASDRLRGLPYWGRFLVVTVLILGLHVYSAHFVLGLGPS